MTNRNENPIDAEHHEAIAYTYNAIQSILQSNPDVSPEEFIKILSSQFPDIDAKMTEGYDADEEDVVTVYAFSSIGSDLIYLHTESGKLCMSDEFLYSMGGGDEDADWERWQFKTDEQTGQTVFLPA